MADIDPHNLDDDQTFLAYVEAHSETPRALFHRGHLVRLYQLAGKSDGDIGLLHNGPEWAALHHDKAQPLVDAARVQLRNEDGK